MRLMANSLVVSRLNIGWESNPRCFCEKEMTYRLSTKAKRALRWFAV